MNRLPQAVPVLLFDRWRRALDLAVKSLWLHRLRSLLTVLGIVFGVCSVIAMLAIGEGASYEAQEQIKNLGSQNIILRSVKPPEEQKVANQQQNYLLDYGLKYADIKRIQETLDDVTVIVPGRVMREYVWNLTRRLDCEVVATVPWYPEMRGQQIGEGRFFSEHEMEARSHVVVLGHDTAENLFPSGGALGSDVRIGEQYYRVIGVMRPAGRSNKIEELNTAAAAPRVFMPLNTAQTTFGEILQKRRSGSFETERVELHEVTLKVRDRDRVVPVSHAVKHLLESTHKKKDYDVVVPLELLRRAEETKRIFNIVLGSIAAISLLVGGIGIMNIMLANVTERTREIGIRRALGAKRRDIVTQFLVESVLLSGAGGLIGVALGLAIPFLVTVFSSMITIVTFWSPVVAFGISALVGVVFGLYPATRAAQMDPVEALRHE
jgi:putative ABC transport system permease protein